MTLGEKIAKQRKDLNYTQEQLADLLGVSRQSISKWESNLAYPETDKLIKMGTMFDCSMDYLLKDSITDKAGGNTSSEIVSMIRSIPSSVKKQFRERKSERTLWGMPLYHFGRNAKGFFAVGMKARGIIAIGMNARGVISFGLLSMGVLSFGLLSMGLISLGVFSLGLLSAGSVALGVFAAGAVSIGFVSFGALAVGEFSAGALAIGKYVAVGDHARAMIALGDSDAAGSVYQHIGGRSSADLAYVKEWLEIHVPSYLSWAKDLFKLYLF